MNLFKRDEIPCVPDLPRYAGNYRGEKNGFKWWEIRDPTQEPFNSILDKVRQSLDCCRSIPPSALLLIDIFIRGTSLESCVLCVMLAGATKRHRKAAIRGLRRSKPLQQYSGLKMDHWDWPPHAPNIVLMGGNTGPENATIVYSHRLFDISLSTSVKTEDSTEAPGNYKYIIVARNNTDATSRTGIVSCAVHTGGTYYLLTPAHIFTPSTANDTGEQIQLHNSDSITDSSSDSEFLRQASSTPSDIRRAISPSTTSESISQELEQDASPVQHGVNEEEQSPNILPIWPISDEIRLFSPELDYALLRSAFRFPNIVFELPQLTSDTIMPIKMEPTLVQVQTLSSGTMAGSIDGRATYMKLPYSNKFTTLYPISLLGTVKEGDCGSPVLDPKTKKIYGFITAASTEGRVAYMIAAKAILDDIDNRVGTVVSAFDAAKMHSQIPLRPFILDPDMPWMSPGLFSAWNPSDTASHNAILPPNLETPPSTAQKQKRRRDDSGGNSGDTGETMLTKRQHKSESLGDDNGEGPSRAKDNHDILACPFYKRDPLKYSACSQLILREVSRVKQHLWRSHQVPIHCVLCNKTFSSEIERDEHIRQRSHCKEKEPKIWVGVTTEQKVLLRRRVDVGKPKSEQWYQMYAVLFPGEPLPENPYSQIRLTSFEVVALGEWVTQEWPSIFESNLRLRFPDITQAEGQAIEQFSSNLLNEAIGAIFDKLRAHTSYDSGYGSIASGFASTRSVLPSVKMSDTNSAARFTENDQIRTAVAPPPSALESAWVEPFDSSEIEAYTTATGEWVNTLFDVLEDEP
ncbi:hypothetical protein VHEMI04078 [[Torrubiella] hemipterigena]|uniref:C2H2-type domain-containing protein n=1 Tax=[Torrubiella] hemipterigena TaxID=1531966 RepID=A0A0A1TCT0_9HYPO|nr:hypothetical protein VHEMI04078 [[Torrubiella] hemipterigena]